MALKNTCYRPYHVSRLRLLNPGRFQPKTVGRGDFLDAIREVLKTLPHATGAATVISKWDIKGGTNVLICELVLVARGNETSISVVGAGTEAKLKRTCEQWRQRTGMSFTRLEEELILGPLSCLVTSRRRWRWGLHGPFASSLRFVQVSYLVFKKIT